MIADATAGNPSIVNYVMFVAVFGMLSLFYLITATLFEAYAISPLFMLAADALNTLFFLVGGIALAGYLRVHSCGNEVSKQDSHPVLASPRRIRSARADAELKTGLH